MEANQSSLRTLKFREPLNFLMSYSLTDIYLYALPTVELKTFVTASLFYIHLLTNVLQVILSVSDNDLELLGKVASSNLPKAIFTSR